MSFAGFSSSEDEEVLDKVPPVPPPQIPPVPPPFPPPPIPHGNTDTGSTMPQEASPRKRKGGNRGGGRTSVLIPSGCSVVYTDEGLPSYVCSCNVSFSKKKNLLRHNELCDHNERASDLPTFKKRRIEDSELFEVVDNVQEDSIHKANFNEDTDGSKLLECKSSSFFLNF